MLMEEERLRRAEHEERRKLQEVQIATNLEEMEKQFESKKKSKMELFEQDERRLQVTS